MKVLRKIKRKEILEVISLIYIVKGEFKAEIFDNNEESVAVERAKMLTEIAEYVLVGNDDQTIYEYTAE